MLAPDLPSLWSTLWFLPPVLAIAVWVSWSDMKFMKIPNTAVLTLAACYLLIGPIALPFDQYLWGWALGVMTLIGGFICYATRLVGAGDVKFAAAMAPFFAGSNPGFVFALFAACLIGAFAAHRLMGRIPAFRRATTDWASWTHADFPMGLALSGTITFYFVAALLISA